ncbi:MAG: hypothetical protein R3C10_03155 [Pirellulales bacterium]
MTLLIFFIAILNLYLGYALAVRLGSSVPRAELIAVAAVPPESVDGVTSRPAMRMTQRTRMSSTPRR